MKLNLSQSLRILIDVFGKVIQGIERLSKPIGNVESRMVECSKRLWSNALKGRKKKCKFAPSL